MENEKEFPPNLIIRGNHVTETYMNFDGIFRQVSWEAAV